MKHFPSRLVLFAGLFFGVLASAALQAAELATAKVLRVDGTATLYREGAGNQPVQIGAILREGDSVSTSHLSEVDLVFSNGSMLTVEENSSLTLAEMKQQAFGGGQSYEQLEADPSQSQTLLELNYGKVRGEVKKLRDDSNFDIETPLGTAAIRGTLYWVELRYNAERGEMLLVIHNLRGIVDLISKYMGEIEYGRGNIGDKGYDTSVESKRERIPERHIVIIRLSVRDPNYRYIVDALKNYPPFQGEDGRPPVIIPLPTPERTPEDPGVIVISPEGPEGDGEEQTNGSTPD